MRKNCLSDISREAFKERVLPILRKARKRTKPTTIDLYDVFNGVLYVLKSGCQWRILPSDFLKWRTSYDYYPEKTPDRTGDFLRITR